MEFTRKCDRCQRFSPISEVHPEELTTMTNPWSFTVWGIDLISHLLKGKGSVQYVVVVVDYFTKWVEVEVLASIIPAKIKECI